MIDSKVVYEKVLTALKKKASGSRPSSIVEWWKDLKELGIETERSAGGWDRVGFLRVTDPMYTMHESYSKHGVLYIPDELVEKILVLGDLP